MKSKQIKSFDELIQELKKGYNTDFTIKFQDGVITFIEITNKIKTKIKAD